MNYKRIATWNTAAALARSVSASSLAFRADQAPYAICFALGAALHTVTLFAILTRSDRS